jgi:ABC-type amino acid transport substrate-binding protein
VDHSEPDLDVFISYSQSRRELTASLAEGLEAAGYSTWWDTDLVAGDNFRDEINKHLEACKAAIIIWTPESIKSEWVLSEASHALRLKKLVNIHVPGVTSEAIPKPFDQRHSVEIDNRAAIIRAVKQRIEQHKRSGADEETVPAKKSPRAAKKSTLEGKAGAGRPGKAGRKDDGTAKSARMLNVAKLDPPPEPTPHTSSRWMAVGLLAAALVAGVAAWIYLTRPVVPQWAFDNKPFFLGEDIPLAWTYEPPDQATAIRFEIESGADGKFRPQTCTDTHHFYVGNINATRSWRLRAVADCETKTPVSEWSEAVEVTQYDSLYERIKDTGQLSIYVSNSQDQDVFKWGDHGFDIDLAKLILHDLSAGMGQELTPVWRPVEWKELLPKARDGLADFAISSITKTAYREQNVPIAFSDSYFCTTHALIYRAGTPEGAIRDMIAGKTVGAQRETTNSQLAETLNEGALFQLELFANTESLKNALIASRIDFAVTDTSFANAAQLDTRLGNGMERLKFKEFEPDDLPLSMQDQQTQNYAIAVRKGEFQLLKAIDDTIAKAKQDGTLATLFKAAAEQYERANDYVPGSRSLGERPWECSSQTAGRN